MTNIKVKSIHLDSARSFIPIEELKKRVEEFSALGYTHLQIGLTDDQGWRFESKKYPKLHKVGAFRDRMILTSKQSEEIDKVKYGGYYKQTELKALVKYAKKHGMDVIPLIDIPGHCSTAIIAYPELASGPVLSKVPSTRGSALYKSRVSTICYTSDFTRKWVIDIFNELMDVFDTEYIHMGFDEIAHGTCEKCGRCNLPTLNKLLEVAYNVILERKKKPIIWWRKEKHNLDLEKFPELTLQWWGHTMLYDQDITLPNDIIFSQPRVLYFDYPESIGGRISILEDMGSFLVHPHGLQEKINKLPKQIIGIGACLWTENLYNEGLRSKHLFPRINILSDIFRNNTVHKPKPRMGIWMTSSYATDLIKLIRSSKLHALRIFELENKMNEMNMGEFLSYINDKFPYINFRSIPLTKISNSVRFHLIGSGSNELERIYKLYE